MTNGKNTPQKPGCDDVNEASLGIRLLGEAELLGGSPRSGMAFLPRKINIA
jgi:hypothetical protein